MKAIKRNLVEVPPRICVACFNAQQQFTFPFLVYCSHRSTLAVIESRTQHTTFPCEPGQLKGLIRMLEHGEMPARGTSRSPLDSVDPQVVGS